MIDVHPDLGRVAGEARAFAQALVRIDTVNPYSGDPEPGREADGQAYLRPLLDEAGATTTLFEPPTDIYERMNVSGPSGRSFTGRPNLVAEFTFGSGRGPRVVMQGHIDTVGVAGMTIEPFSGEIRDGRLRGRGSSDMKGGMAAGLAAVRELARRPGLEGSLVFLSVVDEECDGSGAGALACLDRGHGGDLAICLDGPALGVVHGCRGVVTANVRLRSEGGHAAGPAGPPSALERSLDVARAVLEFRERRTLPVNLGVLRAGSHPAVVATDAVLGVNLSYSMDEAEAARDAGHAFGGARVREDFERRVRTADADAEIVWVKDLIPFDTSVDDPLVRGLARAYERVEGEAPAVQTFTAWSDACYLSHHAGIPTVLFGAGTPGRAHTPDEWADVGLIERSARVLTHFLADLFASGRGPGAR